MTLPTYTNFKTATTVAKPQKSLLNFLNSVSGSTFESYIISKVYRW